ncbi:MAG: elongation factor P [Candidatus Competibacteraceae bacterium]|nr:elongation factor P [Candidatus Competibacteraceae bacterium]
MATTADFKMGMCIEMQGDLLMIVDFQRFQTGRGASNVRTKLRSLNTGKTFEHTFTGGEKIEVATVERRPHQYLYKDENGFVFMNTNTFDQVSLSDDMIENSDLMKEGEHVHVLYHADREVPLNVELPQFVELEITYAEPGISGDTAKNTLKPATLETGAEIRVPLFINAGEKIRVDTRNRAYYERVK